MKSRPIGIPCPDGPALYFHSSNTIQAVMGGKECFPQDICSPKKFKKTDVFLFFPLDRDWPQDTVFFLVKRNQILCQLVGSYNLFPLFWAIHCYTKCNK